MSKRRNTQNFRGKGKPQNYRNTKPKMEKDELKSDTNDVSWYSSDPALIRDVASFPFARPAGTRVGYQFDMVGDTTTAVLQPFTRFYKGSVPGIARMLLRTTCGLSEDSTSAVNVAAAAMYSYVRHANSGHSNYESPDLMIYMLGMSQIYGYINWLQRIYGGALMWSQRNRWIPRALIESEGIDFDDLISNLANFRYGINLLVNKASAFAVPASFTMFNRHAFLYQNYYIEGETIKDQIYYFAPQYFYTFALDEDGSGKLTKLDGINIGTADEWYFQLRDSEHLTVKQLLEYGNTLVNNMLDQEDFGIMSGDILKAYGQGIIKLSSLDEYYSIGFLRDDAVLLQFKNATCLTGIGVVPNIDIHQRNGVIIFEPILQIGAGNDLAAKAAYDILGKSQPLTSNHTDVTNEEVIESTRLMCGLVANEVVYTSPLIVHGSELPICVDYFNIQYDSVHNTTELNQLRWGAVYNVTSNTVGDWFVAAGMSTFVSSFRFHPRHMYIRIEGSGDAAFWFSPGIVFDFDNYTMITTDELQRMHDACLFNMLHVPAVAKANMK